MVLQPQRAGRRPQKQLGGPDIRQFPCTIGASASKMCNLDFGSSTEFGILNQAAYLGLGASAPSSTNRVQKFTKKITESFTTQQAAEDDFEIVAISEDGQRRSMARFSLRDFEQRTSFSTPRGVGQEPTRPLDSGGCAPRRYTQPHLPQTDPPQFGSGASLKRKLRGGSSVILANANGCPEIAAPENPTSHQFEIHDTDSLIEFFKFRGSQIQQMPHKVILKAWIKEIEPKKQSMYPYLSENGKESVKGQRPPWWPENIPHLEPDHGQKEDRMNLIVHFLLFPERCNTEETRPKNINLQALQSSSGSSIGWIEFLREKVDSLKLVFDNDTKEKVADRKQWLNNLFDVAQKRLDWFEGCLDKNTIITYSPMKKTYRPKRSSDPRKKRRVNNEDKPTQGDPPCVGSTRRDGRAVRGQKLDQEPAQPVMKIEPGATSTTTALLTTAAASPIRSRSQESIPMQPMPQVPQAEECVDSGLLMDYSMTDSKLIDPSYADIDSKSTSMSRDQSLQFANEHAPRSLMNSFDGAEQLHSQPIYSQALIPSSQSKYHYPYHLDRANMSSQVLVASQMTNSMSSYDPGAFLPCQPGGLSPMNRELSPLIFNDHDMSGNNLGTFDASSDTISHGLPYEHF